MILTIQNTGMLVLLIPEIEVFQNLFVKGKFSRISYQRGELLPMVLLKIIRRNLNGDSLVSLQSLRHESILIATWRRHNKKELTIDGCKALFFPHLRFVTPVTESLPRHQKRCYQRRNLKNKLWVLCLNQSLLVWDMSFVMQLLENSQVIKRDIWLQNHDTNSQRKTRANLNFLVAFISLYTKEKLLFNTVLSLKSSATGIAHYTEMSLVVT